ncbi:MAG: AAA family ATPase [Bernardetiaceae bacterium]|jgi:MoxR-like ATPase|nr:AAA family ATPase [Bernardetiaceae bacterium]
MTAVRDKVANLLQKLSQGIYEKEETIRLALLTALAGESLFLLGPPGVAKSLVARRLKFAFRDGKSFEYLMNKFSTPDEIFGPVSIKKLKDEDKYERLTDHYLPGANVVFLDEIWKAGPAIQNALLTILNEKIYRNGEQDVAVNIKGILAASNELPASGEGLDALWDRFLVRTVIREIRQAGNFLSMITSTQDVYQDPLTDPEKVSEAELATWLADIDQVAVPDEVLNTIQLVRLKLDEYDAKHDPPFRIYDRRWKKIVHLLRASAYLNGRAQVDLMDCFLMADCLWGTPEHIEVARQLVAETVRKHGYSLAVNLAALRQEINAFDDEVKAETQVPNPTYAEELYLVDRQYFEVLGIENHFEGKYVRSAEFEKLGIDELQTIGVYDEQSKLTYRVKARRGRGEHQIEFLYNANAIILPLKTHKVEKTTYLARKPHPLVLKYWDDRLAQLSTYVQAQQQRLRQEAPAQLHGLRGNLFVDPHLADLVEANQKETLNALNNLALGLEKIQHYYQNL